MPKIAITSDIHLGHTTEKTVIRLIQRLTEEELDIFAIAGDLTSCPWTVAKDFERILELCAERFKLDAIPPQLCVLPGNHDFYKDSRKGKGYSRKLYNELLPKAATNHGFNWLDELEFVQCDDVAILGNVGWYDYSAKDPNIPKNDKWYWANKHTIIADKEHIDGDWSDKKFARECRDHLEEALTAATESPEIKKIVVITHVPVFEEQMTRRVGDYNWNIGSAYFGHLTMGDLIKKFSKVKIVVSGHTHTGRDAVVGDIRTCVIPSEYKYPKALIFDTKEDLTTAPIDIIRVN